MPRLVRSRLPTPPNQSRPDCHFSTRSVWFLRAAPPLLAAETYNSTATAGSPMHHRRLHRVPGICRPRSADGPTPLGAEESLPGVDRIPKIRRSWVLGSNGAKCGAPHFAPNPECNKIRSKVGERALGGDFIRVCSAFFHSEA